MPSFQHILLRSAKLATMPSKYHCLATVTDWVAGKYGTLYVKSDTSECSNVLSCEVCIVLRCVFTTANT